MRSLFTLTLLAAMAAGLSGARAEKQIFILASNAGGDYGIDRCLAGGERCGSAMATALCRQRDFKQAVSYRKVDRDDITGAVPTRGGGCRGASCDDFVAIECTR